MKIALLNDTHFGARNNSCAGWYCLRYTTQGRLRKLILQLNCEEIFESCKNFHIHYEKFMSNSCISHLWKPIHTKFTTLSIVHFESLRLWFKKQSKSQAEFCAYRISCYRNNFLVSNSCHACTFTYFYCYCDIMYFI